MSRVASTDCISAMRVLIFALLLVNGAGCGRVDTFQVEHLLDVTSPDAPSGVSLSGATEQAEWLLIADGLEVERPWLEYRRSTERLNMDLNFKNASGKRYTILPGSLHIRSDENTTLGTEVEPFEILRISRLMPGVCRANARLFEGNAEQVSWIRRRTKDNSTSKKQGMGQVSQTDDQQITIQANEEVLLETTFATPRIRHGELEFCLLEAATDSPIRVKFSFTFSNSEKSGLLWIFAVPM